MEISSDQNSVGQSGSENMSKQLERSSNMFSQLELMMSAVREESATLNSMKEKLKELDVLRAKVPELESKLLNSEKIRSDAIDEKLEQEKLVSQLRLDMQRLNDLYNTERNKHLEVKQIQLRQEQELISARRDAELLQKAVADVGDIQKKNKELDREVAVLEQRLEEEKRAVAKSFQMLEKQNEEAEKVKAELSEHFWNLSEELKQTQTKLEGSEQVRVRLESGMVGINEAFNQSLETSHMAIEDKWSSVREITGRDTSQSSRQQSEIKSLNAKIQELHLHISAIEAAKKDLESEAEIVRKDSAALMSTHADQMQALSDKNKELLASEVRLCHKIEAMERASRSVDTLREQQKEEISRLEASLDDLTKQNKAISAERDEAQLQLQSGTTHTTALETQLKEAHAKQWTDIQKMKEKELQAEMDIKDLHDAIEEKETAMKDLEAEKDKVEQLCQEEISKMSHMSGVLKAELEKRLDELSGCVRERDALRTENGKLKEAVEGHVTEMKKKEKIFQHAIETDRAKVQQEMKARINRIRTLESEKQELLAETSHLMDKLAVEQKSKSSTDRNISEVNKSLTATQEELKACRIENHRLERDLDSTAKRERELQDKLSDMEGQFKMDIARLDSIVKESRKTAAQQVGELTSKCQSLSDELAEERKQSMELKASERQAVLNAENYENDLRTLRTDHEDFQLSAGREIATAKREAQNLHGKVKTLADIKAKMDMELMTLRMERARAGSDVTHLTDKIKTLEDKTTSLETELSNTSEELQKMTASSRRNKASAVDFEANLQRHVKMLSKATEEIERLEKHSFMEGKKMRTNLNNAKRTLQEQSDQIAKLTVEVEQGAANYSKLQSSTNDTISGLIEELKRTEDALSKERQSNSQELSKAHQKLATLQSQLELTKDSMNEKLIQTESERSDKQVMLMQLNSEVKRLGQLSEGKDNRINELEKQHQEDRARLQELRSKISNLESELSDVRVELAKTDKMKRALDVKFQKQVSQASSPNGRQYEDTWRGGGYSVGADEDQRGEKDFDIKNRIYLQDDEDEYHGSKFISTMYDGDGDEGGYGGGSYGSKYDSYEEDVGDDATEHHSHFSAAPVATIDASPINSSRGPSGGDDDDYVDEESFQRAIAAAGTNVPTYGRKPSTYEPDDYAEVDDAGEMDAAEEEDSSSVAASIARTQRFLQKRGKGSKSTNALPSQSASELRSKSRSRGGSRNCGGGVNSADASSGRGGRYPPDGGRHVAGATYLHDNEDMTDGGDFAFGAPSLMPATPPIFGSGAESSLSYDNGSDHDIPNSRESSRSLPVGSREESFSKSGSRGALKSRGNSSSRKSSGKNRKSESDTKNSRDGGQQGEQMFPRISPLRKSSSRNGSA